MRIYDYKNQRALNSILIMLTPTEIHELIGSLKSLNIGNDHVHIDDEDYRRKITIGLYTLENIENFSNEVIQLIQQDE